MLEINDDLLDQYFYQIQAKVDNSPFINPNYKYETYYLTVISFYEKIDYPGLTIRPVLAKYKQTITNDSNYAKLLINILNSFSLWLNLSILNLNIYLLKLFSFVQKIYQLLLKLKNCLNPNKFII